MWTVWFKAMHCNVLEFGRFEHIKAIQIKFPLEVTSEEAEEVFKKIHSHGAVENVKILLGEDLDFKGIRSTGSKFTQDLDLMMEISHCC